MAFIPSILGRGMTIKNINEFHLYFETLAIWFCLEESGMRILKLRFANTLQKVHINTEYKWKYKNTIQTFYNYSHTQFSTHEKNNLSETGQFLGWLKG